MSITIKEYKEGGVSNMAKYFVLEEKFCEFCVGKGSVTTQEETEELMYKEENCTACASRGYNLEPIEITGNVLAEILEIS